MYAEFHRKAGWNVCACAPDRPEERGCPAMPCGPRSLWLSSSVFCQLQLEGFAIQTVCICSYKLFCLMDTPGYAADGVTGLASGRGVVWCVCVCVCVLWGGCAHARARVCVRVRAGQSLTRGGGVEMTKQRSHSAPLAIWFIRNTTYCVAVLALIQLCPFCCFFSSAY